MAIDYAALKTEIQTDPKALGFAALVTAGNDQGIADKLNQVGASGETIGSGVIPTWRIINATDPTEWAALTAQEKQRYQTLTGAGLLDTSNTNVRTAFTSMFAVGTATRTALNGLTTRSAARAEVLFGAGTVITSADVARALRG